MTRYFAILVIVIGGSLARAGDDVGWKMTEAAKYLDDRARVWLAFSSANRGEGETRTTCISCHTAIPYLLARPALRKLTGTDAPTEHERNLLTHVKRRVDSWKDLDTPPYKLFYDFDEAKKKESWGTEGVWNAVVLSFDDAHQGKGTPSDVTRRALANLWQVQTPTGDDKGSWDWLNFGLEPWESKSARYHGAALAAIAVGTAPGYYIAGKDADLDAHVTSLSDYLKRGLAKQNLFNRAFALWASCGLKETLKPEERQAIVKELFDKQQTDGGWSLPSLGTFVRSDKTEQETTSDGYATGLVLHVLQTAGMAKDEARIAKGLAWLRSNQAATGEWRTSSVNKKRDPTTHVGKFMSDAATGYAILALSH